MDNGSHKHPTDKKRVLVVDDERALRSLVQICLGMTESYEVFEATSGEDALEAVRKYGVDIVIMDIRMPGIGGLETCRRLRSVPTTRDIPVIFISAWNSEKDQVAAREAGGTDLLCKPFPVEQLLQMVASHAFKSDDGPHS